MLNSAITLLLDSHDVMVPVVTGFLVLFGGSLAKLWETGHAVKNKSAAVTLILGIFSLGVWTGTMPFCIMATLAQTSPADSNYTADQLFEFARWCARAGHISFFLSVTFGCLFYWQVIGQKHEKVSVAS